MSARIWRVQARVPVRTYDVDFSGNVGNVSYLRWLEDLRIALGEAHYPVRRMLEDGIVPTVVRTEIDYRRPIRLGDDVLGAIWVCRLGTARWTVRADFRCGCQLAAEARQECCFVSAADGRIARVPGWVRAECVPLEPLDFVSVPA